jgi:hypothetical protein
MFTELRVSEVCNIIKLEYNLVVDLNESARKLKEVYCLALYKVETLPSAPVASKLEDMPTDFSTSYIDAIYDADIAVNELRNTIEYIIRKFFNKPDIVSLALGNSQLVTIQFDRNERGGTIPEIIKNALEVVCNGYDKAKQMLMLKMKALGKFVDTILALHQIDAKEALFSVRGELVTASRETLLVESGSFFYGLLSSGKWKTNAIGD